MNYFELYPGDYLRDTMRLSLLDHGAYLRLMVAYYSEEQPLPALHADLYTITSAVSSADKAAVRKVADRYFPVGEDGLRHNNRADEEIVKAQKRIQTARENGAKNKAKNYPVDMPAGIPTDTQPHTRSGEALHTPHATTPPTSTSKTKAGAARGTRLPADWQPSDEHKAYAEQHQVDWRKEVEAFKDWWSAAAGSKGVKLDWDATWRTWVRRAPKAAAPLAPSVPRKPAGPSETPLEKAISYARQQHSYGAIDVTERDRLIAAATEKHREGATA